MTPVLIDDFLNAQPGIVDAAAFGISPDGGNIKIWAAVVADEPVDEAALIAAGRKKLGRNGPARIFQIDEIPRNNMGKVQRLALRDMVPKSDGNT